MLLHVVGVTLDKEAVEKWNGDAAAVQSAGDRTEGHRKHEPERRVGRVEKGVRVTEGSCFVSAVYSQRGKKKKAN